MLRSILAASSGSCSATRRSRRLVPALLISIPASRGAPLLRSLCESVGGVPEQAARTVTGISDLVARQRRNALTVWPTALAPLSQEPWADTYAKPPKNTNEVAWAGYVSCQGRKSVVTKL